MDIDLNPDTNDPRLRADTIPEGVEYLGRYDSLEAYMRDMLAPEISDACHWILDHVDWRAALRRFEGNGRLVIECGQVFRIAAPPPALAIGVDVACPDCGARRVLGCFDRCPRKAPPRRGR